MATVRRSDEVLELPDDVPVVALRDLVFFPYMVLPLLIGRPASLAALEAASTHPDGLLVLVAQRDPSCEAPLQDDLFPIGTAARAVQVTELPDGTRRVVLEGLARVRLDSVESGAHGLRGRIRPFVERECEPGAAISAETEALTRSVTRQFSDYARLHERVSDEVSPSLSETRDRVRLAHLLSGHLLLTPPEKQRLLECATLEEHFEVLQEFLVRELEILRIEEKLEEQIRSQMDSDRRQFYLNEQLKAIHRELGTEAGEEWIELERAVQAGELPGPARERAERELKRLRKLNPVAPEAAVIRTYLDWLLALPWRARATATPDVAAAADILDEAHHGLGEVKDRILDHIAVLSVVGELQGPILCLVGPPGVGKTSLGRSIAGALGREFVRVSLGGVRDEAEIRGHRRTYVGALPGRVLQGMRRSGTTNPVFLLDEVDKLARDFHGDPGAALLEVLDPEQNRTFTDHYLELEYDLSGVLFVATANTLAGIPEPLRDRMEVIRLPGYLDTEKRVIARRFLWPRQRDRHGLDGGTVLSDDTIDAVVSLYTREAGVRELNRRVSRIARKLARTRAEGGGAPDSVEPDVLEALLGPPPYLPPELADDRDRIGLANGLAWTAAGGEVLDVEVAVVPGSGEVRLTGTLGDVMKESAMAALTYARSRARRLGLDPNFHTDVDVHVHIPEGATPKDGPSAGITMAVALVSALTGIPSAARVALTGEITLRGRVLAVGGIKEKAVAALRHGVRTVVLPRANEPELALLPDEVREGVRFVPVTTMDEVLEAALVGRPRDHGTSPIPLSPQ
ncbi:MAG: endopeptidase La [Gemmatimonadetes bacterium]|nr:endopeptidase La [Gemmatimonadota bacterium]NNK64416.1 endopeptidase La [Gemmatimonadota bacterium]